MRLQTGAVHLWQADLDAIGPEIEQLLDCGEKARAQRIVREPVRRRWIAARGVLRALLGTYLSERPSRLRFAYQPRGKPMLDFPAAERLHFNVSHSAGLALYGLSETCPVGVDVELLGRRSKGGKQERDFLWEWVKREAEGKRLGVGVGVVPESAPPATRQPWIAELDLNGEAVGALALQLAPVDFRVYAVDIPRHISILRAAVARPITTNQTFPNISITEDCRRYRNAC
jgi:hypothetical protein